jgi:acyl homoserine lactone synthase
MTIPHNAETFSTRCQPVEWSDYRNRSLLRQYHALRKRVFVDKLGWDLTHFDGYEYDAYDGPYATNIVADSGGTCIAGCRLLRTDTLIEYGTSTFSYTLKDIHKGLFPSQFKGKMLYSPPVSDKIWEISKTVAGKNQSQFRRLMEAAFEFVVLNGGEQCILLSRPAFADLAESWGISVLPAGPITFRQGEEWQAMRCVLN